MSTRIEVTRTNRKLWTRFAEALRAEGREQYASRVMDCATCPAYIPYDAFYHINDAANHWATFGEAR